MIRRALPSAESRQRGYALLLMLVLVTMGLLFTVVSQVSLVGAKVARAQGTGGVMQQAKDALIGYASTYRDNNNTEVFGYLPCPDTDGDGIANPINNSTNCGATNETVAGLLPYRTLGLDALRDSSQTCLWYVVSASFKAATTKATPLNWDTQGKIAVIDASGNSVVAPDDTNGGAAAVIIAAGAPLGVQSRTTSAETCGAVPSTAQIAAYLDGSYSFPNTGTVTLTEGSSSSSTNNDQILTVTPREIFSKIIARADFKNPASGSPSGQINALSNSIKIAIEKQIQSDLIAGGTPTGVSLPLQTGYTQNGSKYVGDLASTLVLAGTSNTNYLTNWRNQYRYAVLNSLTTPTLDIAGTNCRGALLFGGRATTGGPRTSAQNTSSTANLINFFEASGALGILNSASTAFTGQTAYSSPNNAVIRDTTLYSDPYNTASDRAMDSAVCLFPGSFISFAQDISSFSSGTKYAGTGGASLVTVNIGAKTVVLGGSGASGGSACAWDPTALPMSSMARLYFRLNWSAKGNGFTLALADAATNLSPIDTLRSQVMCGANGSTTLGYSGIPSGGSVAGIQKPKLGIEFDTRFDSSRNDPYGDHMAFVYWGDSTDSVPSGSGADDNTHYLGNGGYSITGAYWVSVSGVSAASWSGGVATITTSSPHGLVPGNIVPITNILPSAYRGLVTVATTPSATQFTYALASDPGINSSGGGNVGGVVLTTATAHGLATNDVALVSGNTPGSYDGTGTVAVAASTSLTKKLGFLLTSNPGTFSAGGMVKSIANGSAPRNPRVATIINSVGPSTIVSPGISWTSSTTGCSGVPGRVTMNTNAAHGLASGQTVYVSGISPSGYNGAYTVISSGLNATRFRFCQPINPGAYVSGGIISKGTEISTLSWSGGIASATTSASHPFSTGQSGTVFGVTPNTYDATASITKINSTSLDYSIASDPGGTFSAETPAGMALVKTTDNHLPYSALPTATNIDVRIDISRTYDSTNHVAVLNMKAYIGSTFGIGDCDSTDFQDLSQDLADLTCLSTPTLEQESIPVSAINFSSASWSSGTNLVSVTTSTTHGLANGATVTISGASPSTYNGTYTIAVTGSNTFTYTLTSNPGTYASGASIEPLAKVYLGVTNARSGTSSAEDQSITISNLLFRSQ